MTPPIEEEKPVCTVTDCHFMQCSLSYGHKELHVFTIPPPDEYFEDEEPIEEEKMTDEQNLALEMETVKAHYPDAKVIGMWAIFSKSRRISNWCESSEDAWTDARILAGLRKSFTR